VVIAVGEPNEPLLAALAQGADRIRSGRTLEDLREVFHAELHGPQLAEGTLELGYAPRVSGSLAEHIGASTAELPALERYVRNRLRPGGEVLWQSEAGEPVLAVARAGLGRVALFASLPSAGWGTLYTRSGLGQPAEFEPLLRWLARGPERAPDPRAHLEEGWLRVTGLDPAVPALLPVLLTGSGPEAPRLRLELAPPSGPGADVLGTREARWGGETPLLPQLELDGGPVLPVAVALPEELLWHERELPPELWERGDVPARGARLEPGSSPAAPWVIALGLAAFLAAGLATARGQGVAGSSR